MSESPPVMRLHMEDGSEQEATPQNSSLFMFIGENATRNHAFFQQEAPDENHVIKGMYLFSFHPAFEKVRDFMMEHGFPMHVNLLEVAECDERAYQAALEKEIARQGKDLDDELKGLFE